jgi:hypothetical protein
MALSILATFLAYEGTQSCVGHYKSFNKANRLATGYVIDSEPGGGSDEDYEPPSSHYQFNVSHTTYEGWVQDDLAVGEKILVRYDSSDPNFSHAQWERADWVGYSFSSFFLLGFVLLVLIPMIRHRNDWDVWTRSWQ